MTTHAKTKPTATARAEAVAAAARRSKDHRVEVGVQEIEAEFFEDGELMLPARRSVHVVIYGNRWFDHSGSITFSETLPGQGRSTISRFVGADGTVAGGKYRKLRSEPEFWMWLHCYVTTGDFK